MQAILITAYKNKKNLLKLVKSFNDEMNIYIHIDKKSEELNENDFDKLNFKNLFVIKKYNVEWGSYSHLLAVIDLMNMAVMDDKNTFIHIISGEDYKLKSISYFNENFEDCDKIFCTVTECENLPKKIRERYTKGIFNSYFYRDHEKVKKINQIYTRIHENDSIGEFKYIYKGMIWSSMPIEVTKFILDYVEHHPEYLYDLKHCIIPEEFFIQTIVMNSKYKNNVIKSNLRYTVWERRKYGCNPDYLDEEDFDNIFNSNCIFMRKVDSEISKKLIKKVDNTFKLKNKILKFLTNKFK